MFATLLHAYQECSQEVRAIVDEMAAIIADDHADPSEKDHAADVVLEALFPLVSFDVLETHRRQLRSDEARRAKRELEEQESRFADTDRALMQQRGLTQEQLAEKTGVSQPAISNVLNRCCRPQQRTVL